MMKMFESLVLVSFQGLVVVVSSGAFEKHNGFNCSFKHAKSKVTKFEGYFKNSFPN